MWVEIHAVYAISSKLSEQLQMVIGSDLRIEYLCLGIVKDLHKVAAGGILRRKCEDYVKTSTYYACRLWLCHSLSGLFGYAICLVLF